MILTKKTIKMIKHHEGVRYKPYRDVVHLWTVGCGHLMYNDQYKLSGKGREAYQLHQNDNRRFSEEEVDELLRKDLARFERGVRRFITVSLTDNQYGALISFAFNVGLGNLQRSTLRQKVNREEHEQASKEFLKWVRAGGKVWKGLVRRRKEESELYLS